MYDLNTIHESMNIHFEISDHQYVYFLGVIIYHLHIGDGQKTASYFVLHERLFFSIMRATWSSIAIMGRFLVMGFLSEIFFHMTLPKSNSSPLKMDGWQIKRPLARPIFRGYVSFMEGNWRAKSKEMI